MAFLPVAALLALVGLCLLRDRRHAPGLLGALYFGSGFGLTLVGFVRAFVAPTEGAGNDVIVYGFYPALTLVGLLVGARVGKALRYPEAWWGILPGLLLGGSLGFLAFASLPDSAFEPHRVLWMGRSEDPVRLLLTIRLWAGAATGAAIGGVLASSGSSRTGPIALAGAAFVALAAAVGQIPDLALRTTPVAALVARGDYDGLLAKTRSADAPVASRAAYVLLASARAEGLSAQVVERAMIAAQSAALTGKDPEGVYRIIRGDLGTVDQARQLLDRGLLQYRTPAHARRCLEALVVRTQIERGSPAERRELWTEALRTVVRPPTLDPPPIAANVNLVDRLRRESGRVGDEVRDAYDLAFSVEGGVRP